MLKSVMFWHVPTDPQLSGFEGRDSKTTVRGRCVERVAKDTYCRILHSQASEHSGGKPPEKETHPRERETGKTLGSIRFALDPEGSSVNLAYSSVAPHCFSCMFSY